MYTQVALTGMLGGLGDPYTTYLSPQEINGLDEQLRGGNFGGIGVYIVQDAKTGAILVDPIERQPRDQSRRAAGRHDPRCRRQVDDGPEARPGRARDPRRRSVPSSR